VLAVAVAVRGWQLFYFLTDDAYAAFRYVSNSMAGRGLVWNPAPFRPVEGYNSFLWLVLLRAVWSVTGIPPTESANVVSLCCGLGTLFLTARFLLRMSLPGRLEAWRFPFLALVLLGTVTNRTYLTWLSSGMDAALFNLLLTWWIYEGTARTGRERPGWIFRLSLSAALCALCETGGLLAVVATPAILLLERPEPSRREVAALSPLFLVPVHEIWRRVTYGAWLSNFWRAHRAPPWPASGVRYLASFALEYGLWWWLGLAILAVAAWWRGGGALVVTRPRVGRVLPIVVLLTLLAYDTFFVGGDYFEYRVYSVLIPFLFLSAVWLVAAAVESGRNAAVLVAFLLLASWPIPWVHWLRTRNLMTRDAVYKLATPVANAFPWPFRPLAAEWDSLQWWLVAHLVCVRHQEHKINALYDVVELPPREQGELIPWDAHDVYAGRTIGVTAWALPNVAVIDFFGDNDRVIAEHPVHYQAGELRQMIYNRIPPSGYVPCFRANVRLDHAGHYSVGSRPLTDEEIQACEAKEWH
jgi:arabinofuranosyltransferase